MPAKFFLDTSVLVYLLKSDDPRANVAEDVLSYGGVVSVQILNEFTNVARWKLHLEWDEVKSGLAVIRHFCEPVSPVTFETHQEGIRIAQRNGYRIYDSLLIASAIEAGCTTLYSEDMQHGQTIGPLTIRNPFQH